MEKFLKENWFRIIIVLIFGVYLISNINFSNKDVFVKKQECVKYYDLANTKIKESGRVFQNDIYTLNEVFYSPKMNTCLYAYTIHGSLVGEIYSIYDVFGASVYDGTDANTFQSQREDLKRK